MLLQFLIFALKAIHNKDYSVVKTFSASPTCGAFFCSILSLFSLTSQEVFLLVSYKRTDKLYKIIKIHCVFSRKCTAQ